MGGGWGLQCWSFIVSPNGQDLNTGFSQQVDDQEANEGRTTVVDFHSDGGVDEVKKFLKEAQHTREKIVAIEELVNQIREYHGKITGAAARNEGTERRYQIKHLPKLRFSQQTLIYQ